MNLFVVHGWHTPKTSLYPHLCDGIEYIDGAIEAIRRAAEATKIEFNIDHKSFVSGETLRYNLKKNIEGADIVVVLLDGLRPNIVYELGYAEAIIRTNSKKRILLLKDYNATILVRNFYDNHREIPTTNGKIDTIINPTLNVYRDLCDSGDRILMNYDRFNLFSLEENLKEYFTDYKNFREKADNEEMEPFGVNNSINTNNSPENNPSFNNPNDLKPEDKLTYGKALFLEKKFTKALEVFKELLKDPNYKWQCAYYSACCYLLQEKYCEAMLFLNKIIIQKNYPKQLDEINIDIATIKNMYRFCVLRAFNDVDLEKDDTDDENPNDVEGENK